MAAPITVRKNTRPGITTPQTASSHARMPVAVNHTSTLRATVCNLQYMASMATRPASIMTNTATSPEGIPSTSVSVYFIVVTKNTTVASAAVSTSPLIPSR